jgi:tape measure domain-containing protein
MADDIVKLGFEVDSTPLAKAGKDAQAAAKDIGAMGNAADSATKKINPALKQTATEMNNVGKAAKAMTDGIQGTSAKVGQLAQAFGIATGSGAGVALNGAISAALSGVNGLAGAMGAIGPLAGSVTLGVGTLATAFVGASAAIATVQDQFAMYEGRLKNALGSQSLAEKSMASLSTLARETGVSVSGTIDVFTRMARSSEALGATTPDLLKLTDTVQKLGIVSGASTGEVASGMLQLSQALASGRLNGDELRSIMENMPALAKAIADGLGISVGQLRAMGAAGELTGQKVFSAILSQGNKVQEEFEKLPDTVERSFTRVTNSLQEMLANMGKSLGSSEFVQGLLKLADKAAQAAKEASAPKSIQQQIADQEADVARLKGTYGDNPRSQTGKDMLARAQERLRKSLETRDKISQEEADA